jgi:hypothetical protein
MKSAMRAPQYPTRYSANGRLRLSSAAMSNSTALFSNGIARSRIADYKAPDFSRVGDDPVPRNQNGRPQKGRGLDVRRCLPLSAKRPRR